MGITITLTIFAFIIAIVALISEKEDNVMLYSILFAAVVGFITFLISCLIGCFYSYGTFEDKFVERIDISYIKDDYYIGVYKSNSSDAVYKYCIYDKKTGPMIKSLSVKNTTVHESEEAYIEVYHKDISKILTFFFIDLTEDTYKVYVPKEKIINELY